MKIHVKPLRAVAGGGFETEVHLPNRTRTDVLTLTGTLSEQATVIAAYLEAYATCRLVVDADAVPLSIAVSLVDAIREVQPNTKMELLT